MAQSMNPRLEPGRAAEMLGRGHATQRFLRQRTLQIRFVSNLDIAKLDKIRYLTPDGHFTRISSEGCNIFLDELESHALVVQTRVEVTRCDEGACKLRSYFSFERIFG